MATHNAPDPTAKTPSPLEAKLARAAELQTIVDAAKEAKKELEPLRFELLQDMIAEGSTKKAPVGGYYALYVQTPKRYVENPEVVLGWLEANDYNVDAYKELSSGKVLKLADEVLEADGEVLPGLGVDVAERIDIKRYKEKK